MIPESVLKLMNEVPPPRLVMDLMLSNVTQAWRGMTVWRIKYKACKVLVATRRLEKCHVPLLLSRGLPVLCEIKISYSVT